MGEETPTQPLGLTRWIFIIAQFAFWGFLLWMVVRRNARGGDSQFRDEKLESRRLDRWRRATLHDVSMDAEPVLELEGFVIDRPAHEILGISREATPAQIAKAYRHLMKRYHPDRIAPLGSAHWKDAQKIAEAINRARDEMLHGRKRQG